MNTITNSNQKQESSLKKVAARGAIWLSLISALAVPLSYYRSWILARFDSTGEVVGTFSVILLFIELVFTFVLIGGSSVMTNFLPKMDDAGKKTAFIYSYVLITIPFSLIFFLLIYIWPELLFTISSEAINASNYESLLYLVPFILMGQMTIFALSGLMQYRLLSVLLQLQLLCVATFTTVVFFLEQDILLEDTLYWLSLVIMVANLLIFLFGLLSVRKVLARPKKWLHVPDGFWRFLVFIHSNTICSFAYVSIDKLFVLSTIGVEALGGYFVLSQCADLIRFIPSKIGQVLLASFSKLIADDRTEELKAAYQTLSRLIVILSTCCTLGLIIFSELIAGLFGNWVKEQHTLLILLAAIINIGSIGSINSMLILAKNRSGYFLVNSIILITLQLIVTFFTIKTMGLYGVILGKLIGVLSGQLGLFIIVYRYLGSLSFKPPKEYWLSQFFVLLSAIVAFNFSDNLNFIYSLVILFVEVLCFFYIVKFNPLDIIKMIKAKTT